MLARNVQVSHADMAAGVTSFSLPAIDLSAIADMSSSVGTTAMAAIDGEINRRALMIAYLDNFYMLFWVLLAIAPLSLLLKPPKPVADQQRILVEEM